MAQSTAYEAEPDSLLQQRMIRFAGRFLFHGVAAIIGRNWRSTRTSLTKNCLGLIRLLPQRSLTVAENLRANRSAEKRTPSIQRYAAPAAAVSGKEVISNTSPATSEFVYD